MGRQWLGFKRRGMEYNKMKPAIVFLLLLFETSIFAEGEESSQITLLNKTSTEAELLLEYVPLDGIREIYRFGSFSIQINALLADNELIDYDLGDAHLSRDHIEIYNGDSTVRKTLTLYCLPSPYNYWLLVIGPHGNWYDSRWYEIPEKTNELDIYYNIVYPNRDISKEFHSKIIIGQKNTSKINARVFFVCIGLLVFGVLLIVFFAGRTKMNKNIFILTFFIM